MKTFDAIVDYVLQTQGPMWLTRATRQNIATMLAREICRLDIPESVVVLQARCVLLEDHLIQAVDIIEGHCPRRERNGQITQLHKEVYEIRRRRGGSEVRGG